MYRGIWGMSKSANQKIKLVAGALGVIACFFAFVLFFYTAKSHIDYSNSVEIDSTFDVTINDMEFNDILLEGYTFPTIKKGDHITYTFTLPDKYISDAVITVDKGCVYDGTEQTPGVSVVLAGETLTEGEDYTLFYSDNIKAGSKASVNVDGIGNYAGSAVATVAVACAAALESTTLAALLFAACSALA